MSDNRRVLVAKRKNDRGKCTNLTQTFRQNQDINVKRGIKRPVVATQLPKKNIANDRLKRLRVSLNDEAQKSGTPSYRPNDNTASNTKVVKNVKSRDNVRKRTQCERPPAPVAVKQPKPQDYDSKPRETNCNPFVFKEEHSTQKNIFTTSTVNPFGSHQSIIVQNSNENDEAMEWSTMDNDVSSLPKSTASHDSSSGTSKTSNVHKNEFLIVVDTNIFLSNLQIIKDIINLKVIGDTKPVIIIPWMVIEELDFIKEDSKKTNLRFKAQEANRYIDNILGSKNDRMRGQSLAEVSEQRDTGKSPDNKIIACCLQILENRQKMVLLTADINLKNKAHFNDIPVCSHTEIMAKILTLNQAKAPCIMHKITELCKIVIHECAKEAYGTASVKMAICQTPLESVQDCIAVFTKYWFPVFQETLMKQFKKAIDDLSVFLSKNINIADGSAEINDLVRLCVRLCLYLKDVQGCKVSVENTIRDLNNIKES